MHHKSRTCRCNSTGAFRIAVSPPASNNSKARTLKWFAANDDAVQDETDQHRKQYGKLTRITEMRSDAGVGTCCLSASKGACAWPSISPPTTSPNPTGIPLWIIAAHADEPSPLGNQLDRVARMLDAGGCYADARNLRLLVWVSCGAGV
jgi:hypothetical protein